MLKTREELEPLADAYSVHVEGAYMRTNHKSLGASARMAVYFAYLAGYELARKHLQDNPPEDVSHAP